MDRAYTQQHTDSIISVLNKSSGDVTLRDQNEARQDPVHVVARQVRKYRLAANFTQDELSEKCGIYRTYLSRIEAGSANPTVSVLWALSCSLNVNIQDFFNEPGQNVQ